MINLQSKMELAKLRGFHDWGLARELARMLERIDRNYGPPSTRKDNPNGITLFTSEQDLVRWVNSGQVELLPEEGASIIETKDARYLSVFRTRGNEAGVEYVFDVRHIGALASPLAEKLLALVSQCEHDELIVRAA